MAELDSVLSLKLTRRDLGKLALAELGIFVAASCERGVTLPSKEANGSREAIDSGVSPIKDHFWREDGMSRFDFKFPDPRDKSKGNFTLSLKGRALKIDTNFREGTILPDIFMRVVFDAKATPFKVVQELGLIQDISKDPVLSGRQEIILPADLDPTKPHTLFTSWERWQFGGFFWDGNPIPARDASPTKRASISDDRLLSVREMLGRAACELEA